MLLAEHKSFDSICAYVSAVRAWAKSNDRPDPALDITTSAPDTKFKRFLKAIKRKLAGKLIKRCPLEGSKFRDMLQLQLQPQSGSLVFRINMRAAMMLAWFALLRVSEYTSKTEEHDPESNLCRRDITFFPSREAPEGFRVNIKVSKTDQWRVGHTLVIYATGDPTFCPVKEMQHLFDIDPQPDHAPLFNFADPRETTTRSMARRKFISAFNFLVVAVGLQPMEIMSHSLRSGGATALLRAGVAPIVVTQLGRWKSWCWTTYTWASEHHIKQAHRDMAHATTTSSAPVNLNAVRYGGTY